jgi:endonuclease-8
VPEGHSLHRLARSLTRSFGRRPVRASSPQGRFEGGAALIDGTVLRKAEAYGKHLFVAFEGDQVLHVHLGLYGTWVRAAAPAPEPWGAVRLRLENDEWYADLRGPTACDLVGRDGRAAIVRRLGPDPLRKDADPQVVVERVTRSRAPVGALLMQQEVLAGVGNVYRAELLHRHRVSPFAEGRHVPAETVSAMWDDLVVLMKDGVRRGRIVTVAPADVAALTALDHDRPAPDDPELDGGEDTLARRRVRRSTGVYVYRRDGRECLRCGATIAAADFHGRRLYWCPGCQT